MRNKASLICRQSNSFKIIYFGAVGYGLKQANSLIFQKSNLVSRIYEDEEIIGQIKVRMFVLQKFHSYIVVTLDAFLLVSGENQQDCKNFTY